jgi:hypothetical protein
MLAFLLPFASVASFAYQVHVACIERYRIDYKLLWRIYSHSCLVSYFRFSIVAFQYCLRGNEV